MLKTVKEMYESAVLKDTALLSTYGGDFWNEYIQNHKEYDRLFMRMYKSFVYFLQDGTETINDVTEEKIVLTNKYSIAELNEMLQNKNFEKNYIACMNELTVEMVQEFLTSYGIKCEKKKSTVDRCMDDVMVFLVNYKRSNKDFPISQDDLFFTKKVRTRNNRTQTVKIPKFRIEYEDSNGIIFRDMPQEAFEIIYANIFNNHKRILMAVALQAFAGLRPSEALNVRRTDSVLGAGLMFEMVNGIITDVSIDLNKEYNLRSDLMKVGGIKKERTQKVFIDFLPEFIKAYNEYMDYM